MRMRSPSSAPPPLRRVGSTASTAIRSLSSWSRRKRRTSSSVSDDLPEPPVPVMPSTGTGRPSSVEAARVRISSGSRPASATEQGPRERGRLAGEDAVPARRGLRAEVDVAGPDHRVDHPRQAHALAVGGGEDVLDAVGVQAVDLVLDDDAPAAAVDLHVPRAALAQQVDEVAEVLDVPALVRADGDAVRVLLDRGRDHLVDRAVVPEVDHLGALPLQDPPHDVDRRVVPVEQARRGDEADRVGRDVELVRHRSSQYGSAGLAANSRTSKCLPSSDSHHSQSEAVVGLKE